MQPEGSTPGNTHDTPDAAPDDEWEDCVDEGEQDTHAQHDESAAASAGEGASARKRVHYYFLCSLFLIRICLTLSDIFVLCE